MEAEMTKYPFVALGMAVAFASVVLPSTYSYADRPAAEGGSGSGYRKVQKAKKDRASRATFAREQRVRVLKKGYEATYGPGSGVGRIGGESHRGNYDISSKRPYFPPRLGLPGSRG
jgi:hypothetical protein